MTDMNTMTNDLNLNNEGNNMNTEQTQVEQPKAKATRAKKNATVEGAAVPAAAEPSAADRGKAELAKIKADKAAIAAQAKAEKAAAKAKEDAEKAAAKIAKEAEKAAKAAEADKPAPTYAGFEIVEGADVDTLAAMAKETLEAVDAIGRKDSDLRTSYLALGAFQSKAAPMFKSTKVYGQFLAKELPATQALDPALRSNCKWLYEALNVEEHEGNDLLAVLHVNRIEDFKSGNPTVIKREYKIAKDKATLAAKAKDAGEEGSEDELAAKAKEMTKAEKEAAEKAAGEAFDKALKRAIKIIRKEALQHDDKADAIEELLDYLKTVARLNPDQGLAFLSSGGQTETE